MGNGQDFLGVQIEERCDRCFAHGFWTGIIIGAIVAFAGTTYCFYAHFGTVIHAAQKAGAEVQHVENHIVSITEKVDAEVQKATAVEASAGDKLTDMQLKYRAAPLLERMKMRTELDKATDAAIKESGK